MYLTLGVNGRTRKSKSMEIKAVKSCLLTFSKSTWITLYNFVCVGANLFQFSFRYDVFSSGKCRMRCPESNVRIGKQICVSALALLLYEIPYEYLHQNFDRKQRLFSVFGLFCAVSGILLPQDRLLLWNNGGIWNNDKTMIKLFKD